MKIIDNILHSPAVGLDPEPLLVRQFSRLSRPNNYTELDCVLRLLTILLDGERTCLYLPLFCILIRLNSGTLQGLLEEEEEVEEGNVDAAQHLIGEVLRLRCCSRTAFLWLATASLSCLDQIKTACESGVDLAFAPTRRRDTVL